MGSEDSIYVFKMILDRPVAYLADPGTERVDGVTLLDLDQVIAMFGRDADAWREEWRALLGRHIDAEATPLTSTRIRDIKADVYSNLIHKVKFPHLTLDQWLFVEAACAKCKIDPRSLYVKVDTNEDTGQPQVKIITTIAAVRAMAARTGNRSHETTPDFCAKGGEWTPSPWCGDKPPHASRVFVTRRDTGEQVEGIAYFDQCAQYIQDKATRLWSLREYWDKGAAPMLGKCAAVAAHRNAWPELFIDLMTTDETHVARRPDSPPEVEAAADAPAHKTGDVQSFIADNAPFAPPSGLLFFPDDPRKAVALVDDTTPDLQGLPMAMVRNTAIPSYKVATQKVDEYRIRMPRTFAASVEAFCAVAMQQCTAEFPPN